MDIYMTEDRYAGSWVYQIWVDGKQYDSMSVRKGHPPLTWSQQWDVVAGYREALDTPN